MSTVSRNEKPSSGESPVCGKSRGNRLARRARSFKEDFLEIISQMRSPGGSAHRSGSPCSPKNSAKTADIVDGEERNPSKDLECNVRQAQFALKHFRDVVSKNKLEMLPGNGTVVLETVTAIHVLLKKYVLNEQSSTLVSATNQLYQSVAKLIRLCDEYLLIGEKALVKENVAEVVKLVEDAIQNIVSLTKDKLTERDTGGKLAGDGIKNHTLHKPRTLTDKGSLDLTQRSSLPDIPLTPREREILEQTSAFVLERHSQSTENVLRASPPPKPPHPDRVYLDSSFPPPLPPKKRHKQLEDFQAVKSSIECLSLRSKSPEDSSSLLSASAGSLDSVLNHSREEEEMRVLMDPPDDSDHLEENILIRHFYQNGSSQSCCYDSSSSTSTEQPIRLLNSSALCDSRRDSPVFVPDVTSADNSISKLDRLSGSQAESGFCSMPSRRSSCQSYSTSSQQLSSTRSSQQSYTSQESHHMERKITLTDKFKTSYIVDCSQNQSMMQTTSHKVVSNSMSSEKLSYQKQTYCKRSSEPLNNDNLWSINDSPKRLQDIPCCHNEVTIHECHLHAANVSSPTGSLRNSPKQLSPIHGNTSPSQDGDIPPALPEKTRSRGTRRERHPSQYDNVPEGATNSMETSHNRSCVTSQSETIVDGEVVDQKKSTLTMQNAMRIDSHSGVTNVTEADMVDGTQMHFRKTNEFTEQSIQNIGASIFHSSSIQSPDGQPPPLPPKKKHIMAYMEMFGNASHANTNEFLRHSVYAYNLLQSEWQQHEMMLTSTQSCSFNLSSHSNQTTPSRMAESKLIRSCLPPALPPKKGRTRSITISPPVTPSPKSDDQKPKRNEFVEEHKEQPLVINKNNQLFENEKETAVVPHVNNLATVKTPPIDSERETEASILDKLDVTQYLVFKKPEDEGPDIRGGHPDALIIHATKAHKNDFLYQEAFLTTYRTFMTPLELIQKLCYRHDRYTNSQDPLKQRTARESFSLLVRVVGDLTSSDLDQVVLQTLMEFVQQLLCRGDLTMAKALRVIMLSKQEAKKQQMSVNALLPSHNIYTRQSVLLDFKSEQIAEQMTLLDAELFLKIEIPEVLTWAQEQNEERSPNLTRFTEHFNKMSYWARSRILEQNEAKDREKYVVKFIKIMKHLRKINNFNSYLALLSALDSAPIRRLEWQKHITEGLKEYCALIDSSSSFRAYRQALAETQPPCIPYIGLVLQDLTFVHIGNTNLLSDGGINFSKRWQQFNIVENMKRFKKGSYQYKKNERIIAFFNGFDESLSEEAMWQISEKIKPRGGKKN